MTLSLDESNVLLLVDDDTTFCKVLGKAMDRRGYSVHSAHSVGEALPLIKALRPTYAIFDLNLNRSSGLKLVSALHKIKPNARIVVLTGYGTFATAVDAVRLGATHFLAKPANVDEVVAAFSHIPHPEEEFVLPPLPPMRGEAEYLIRLLDQHNGNVTQTANSLNMHRRTLQRKLARFMQDKS